MKEAGNKINSKNKKPATITPLELKRAITDLSPITMSERSSTSVMAQLEVEEYADKIRMRHGWSNFLMCSVGVTIIFQMTLFFLVGRGVLKFDDPWLARMLFPSSFGEILGFVYIVINFLFPNQDKNNK